MADIRLAIAITKLTLKYIKSSIYKLFYYSVQSLIPLQHYTGRFYTSSKVYFKYTPLLAFATFVSLLHVAKLQRTQAKIWSLFDEASACGLADIAISR